jgi:4'-phosphopantetheinyl transferase
MISTNKQGSVEVYFSEFSKHDALESWLDLHSSEQMRAARFTQEQDQMAFAIVRSVLKRILSDKIGVSIQEITFFQNRYGKLSCPQAPNLHFSIAHTEEVFVLAFSKDGQIGVDIESMHRVFAMEKLKQLVFTENERFIFLDLLSDDEKQRMCLQTWTQKEALTKCLGITLQEGMQAFEIEEVDGRHVARSNSDRSSILSLKTIEIHSYLLSVCSAYVHESDLQLNNIEVHHSTPLFV